MLRHLIVLLFLSCSCVTSELLNLREGSTCIRNGVSGKCVSIYDCLSSYLDFVDKDYAPICSFRGKEPIICCTDCTFNDTRNFVINPNVGIIHKTGQKAQDKCIEYIHRLDYPCKSNHNAIMERVHNPDENCNEVVIEVVTNYGEYGGVDAFREEFPHMGLLGYGDDTATADWLCGGTVISERFILTAGHCLSSPTVGPVKYVALGILKRTDPSDLWQIYNVKRRISHPEYEPPSKYQDIALLETDTEITFSRQVLPACLHATGEAGEQLYATGWGALGHRRELADTLQKLHVTWVLLTRGVIVGAMGSRVRYQVAGRGSRVRWARLQWRYLPDMGPGRSVGTLEHHLHESPHKLVQPPNYVLINRFKEDECSNYYPRHRHLKNGYNHTTQMCYGDKDGKDTCEGDSGGPLQTSDENDFVSILDCVYKVFGVTSYGRQCGIASSSGIYTRVIHYIPWIESIVWP